MAELKEHLISQGESNVEADEIVEATNTNSHAKESSSLDCDVESQNANGCQVPAYVLRYLYAGHFLARWGTRMWEFSVGLFMLDVYPSSLLLTALYGVVETASMAIFGPVVGDWIDRIQYIKVLKIWLGLQNLSFIIAGGAVSVLLICPSSIIGRLTFIALVIVINACGALGALASLGGAILIERDWLVVISEGQPPHLLTQMNAVTRRIDLSCKLLAPVAVGFIMSFVSVTASAIFLVVWNTLSIGLEYWLLSSVYHAIPALNLKTKRGKRSEKVSSEQTLDHPDRETSTVHLASNEENTSVQEKFELKSWRTKLLQKFLHIPTVEAWLVYVQQDVVLAGFALAMLYFTVLSFGTLMTATLKWKGIQSYVLSLARGVSALVGISATFLYPTLHSHFQSLRIGLWSIWIQWCILLPCVASIWVHNQLVSAWMLMKMSSWCSHFSIRRLLLHEKYTTLTRSFCSGSVRKRRVDMSKQERAQAVNSFVKQYMLQFPGKFPSCRLVQKEVGGNWDVVRQAIAELKISLKTSQDRKQNADVNEGALEAAESVAPENLSTDAKSNDATLMEINGLKQKAHSSFDKISEIDLPVNQKPTLSHSIEKGSITQSFSDGSLLPMLSEKLYVENTAYEEDCSIAPTCPRGLSRTNLFDNQGKTSLPSSNNKWKQEITSEKVENNACNEGYSSFVHSKGLSSTDIELQNMELDKARGGIPVPASTDTDELAVKNNTNKEVNCYNANKEANYSAITSKKSELFASSTPKKMVSKQSTEVRSTWHAQGVTLSPKVENKHEERGSYVFKNAWSLERSAASSDINIELKNLEPGKVRGIAVAASTDMDEIAVENNKNKEVNCSTITLKNLELDKLGGLCVAASTDLDEITVENKANKETNSSAITSNIRELLSSSTPAKRVSEQSTEVGSTWHVRGVTLSPKVENKQEERGSDVSENASLLGRSAAKAETNTRTRIPQQTKRPGQDQSNRRFPSTSAFLSHKDSDDEREDDSDFAAFDYPEPNRGDRPAIPRTNIRLNMPGFPEKPENLQCLVMFLPCSATAHDLHMAFGDCGRITEVNIIQSRKEENRFNYASIIFKTKEALQKALMKKDVVVSGGDVLVKVASSSNQNKCQDSAPRVVENIAVPLTEIKIPRCTVMIKDLPHGLSFKHLKDALAFFGTVSHFVMGSSNSIIYVEFETDDAKERALMAHWISVGGKELQIRRVESPRTPVVRISNVSSETGVTKILNVCKSFGRVKRLDRRDIDIVDVHFRQTELGSMLNILDSLNGVIMDQCRWHAQPAPVFSPETLQSLWSSADGKEYLHSVIQNLFRVINENCFDENDVHELAAQYFREQFSRTKQPVIPTV